MLVSRNNSNFAAKFIQQQNCCYFDLTVILLLNKFDSKNIVEFLKNGLNMETTWISPKIIIGKEATGDYYFVREDLENEIWEEIKKGNNILLVAPRRVGKTSIMKSLAEQSNAHYKLIFSNIQGIDEESEFYKTIYELIKSCLKKSTRYIKQFGDLIETVSELTTTGIKFDKHEIDYLAKINQLIPQLKNESIVLLIDELPEVLYNLYKNGKKEDANSILKNMRRWRQQKGFEKIQFVLAGSIGFHYVIDLIGGRPADINDIYTILCPALDNEKGEFEKYMDWVTKGSTIKYNKHLTAYLKEKISYFVPFFINLMINEVNKTCKKNNRRKVTTNDIDKAVSEIPFLYKKDFSDWKKRLKDYMPKEDFAFVNEILIHAAHKNEISIQEIYNLASVHDKKDCYMEFIANLEQDGYIVKQNEKHVFISPFLKEFWKNDNPVID